MIKHLSVVLAPIPPPPSTRKAVNLFYCGRLLTLEPSEEPSVLREFPEAIERQPECGTAQMCGIPDPTGATIE